MNKEEFRIGDVVEALTVWAQRHVESFGDVVVGISEGGEYLRFKGRPHNGHKATSFKKKIISLENI